MLDEVGQVMAANYLVEMEVMPHVSKDGEVRRYYEKLDFISEELLTRVYLREIGSLALRKPMAPAFSLEDDILSFLDWSYIIAKRKVGEEAPLWFTSQNLKVGCVLVAASHGPDPYVRRVQEYATKGADAVYLMARGANVAGAIDVANEIERLKIGLTRIPNSDRKYHVKLEEGLVDAVAILFRPVRMNPQTQGTANSLEAGDSGA
jgi:hypothetical protein